MLLLLLASLCQSPADETSSLLTFSADKRPGAIIFTDECLARGLTNSMTLAELRAWATNVIEHYSQRSDFRTVALSKSDVPKAVLTLQTRIPSCKHSYPRTPSDYDTIAPDPTPPVVAFERDRSGHIEAVSISWRGYGVIVGQESFVPKWDYKPWYSRKLTDGVYLWHGYD